MLDHTLTCHVNKFDEIHVAHAHRSDSAVSSEGSSSSEITATLRCGDWEGQVPLQLRIRGASSGKPDIQLQLFDLRWGTARRGVETSTSLSQGKDSALIQPVRRRDSARTAASRVARQSAVLAFASLLFPDTVSPVVAYMAVAGFVAASGTAVAAVSASAKSTRGQQSVAERTPWKSLIAGEPLKRTPFTHFRKLGHEVYRTAHPVQSCLSMLMLRICIGDYCDALLSSSSPTSRSFLYHTPKIFTL